MNNERKVDMSKAIVTKTVDLHWKGGYVECACGWRKELGNGFNGYHIASCPACAPSIETRDQRKVVFGERGKLTAEIGHNLYFALSNGIHIRYAKTVVHRETGLTEKQADRL